MKWEELATELETIMSIPISQLYFPFSNTWPSDLELNVFVDASTKAYGNVKNSFRVQCTQRLVNVTAVISGSVYVTAAFWRLQG